MTLGRGRTSSLKLKTRQATSQIRKNRKTNNTEPIFCATEFIAPPHWPCPRRFASVRDVRLRQIRARKSFATSEAAEMSREYRRGSGPDAVASRRVASRDRGPRENRG